MKAGIKIWLLTGDKMETAFIIARSCRLINPDTTVIIVKKDYEQVVIIDRLSSAFMLQLVNQLRIITVAFNNIPYWA